MRVVPFLVVLSLVGCQSDIGVTKSARCNGILEPNEDFVDSPFDRDGDGYYDGNNAECADFYPEEMLDCDDATAEANPGNEEVACNSIDDDCDATTADETDLDEDRYTSCEECDDTNPAVNPAQAEVGCNDLDDDCDPATDDGDDDDGDGYTDCIDCDDALDTVNPGTDEVLCDGLDNDCNVFTGDGADADGDGSVECDDCDEGDDTVYPGADEVCDNEKDDDCDDQIDEECDLDYTDTWTLDDRIEYDCAWGSVTIDFDEVLIIDDYPDIDVASTGRGSQPGTMSGSFSSAVTWAADRTLSGSCDEIYEIEGTFLDENTFEATFTAAFVGSCFDCSTQTWTFQGTR